MNNKKWNIMFDQYHKITPIYNDDYICLAFSSNDDFIIYAGVMIKSIIENSEAKHNYDIIILHKGITLNNMQVMVSLIDDKDNYNIRFVNLKKLIGRHDFYLEIDNNRLTEETYYRLYLQDILSNEYERVVYLDADMIAEKDVYQLNMIDIEDYYVAAVRDYVGIMNCYKNKAVGKQRKLYFQNEIGIKNISNYFNAGFLILNLKELRKNYDSKRFEQIALEKHWLQHDQDVLNHICVDDKVKFVDPKWNVTHHGYKEIKYLPNELQKQYYKSEKTPYIIHYAGTKKPWKDETINEVDFWFYAVNTPFIDQIIEKNKTFFLNRKTIDLYFFEDHNIISTENKKLIKEYVIYLANSKHKTRDFRINNKKEKSETKLLHAIEIKINLYKKYKNYSNEKTKTDFIRETYDDIKEYRNFLIKNHSRVFSTCKQRIDKICQFLRDHKGLVCKQSIIGYVGIVEYNLVSLGTRSSWIISLVPNAYYKIKETFIKK